MWIWRCWQNKAPGFSGADLANMMNEAAILAADETEKRSPATWRRPSIGPLQGRRNGVV